MRETIQTVTTTQEITVEGPGGDGYYRTGDGYYFAGVEGANTSSNPAHAEAIRQHIASAPKPVRTSDVYEASKVFYHTALWMGVGTLMVGETDLTEPEAVTLLELLRKAVKNG